MPPRSRRPQPARVSFRWTYGLVGAFVLLALGSGGFLVAAHMEDDDTFCASCHTQPESTYVSRAQAGQPTDLASYHTGAGDTPTKCIDCHSGSGVPGRAAAMTLGAFDLVSYLTGNARQPAPLTNPISDANCLKCHADTAATRDFNRHFHRFLSQWQAADPQAGTCVSCHTGHATDGDPTLVFLNEQHTVAVCERCHAVAGEGGR